MALTLTPNNFKPIPEGTHVFKITKVEYKEQFGKIEVHLETAQGKKHIERYNIKNKNGEINNGALSAFSFFARIALQSPYVEEIEPADLVGKFISAVVEHQVVPSTSKPGETVTFIKLADKQQANGFEGDVAKEQPKAKASFDLDLILPF